MKRKRKKKQQEKNPTDHDTVNNKLKTMMTKKKCRDKTKLITNDDLLTTLSVLSKTD